MKYFKHKIEKSDISLTDHMGPEDPSNLKKIPKTRQIEKKYPSFFVDAKFSQIARGFQKSKS